MKKLILVNIILAIVGTLAAGSAFGQRETETGVSVDKDISLLRRDLQADKKKLIAMNVSLTETESTKFWPVYDQYAEEMRKANAEFYAVVKEYTTTQKTITDAQAIALMKRWTDNTIAEAIPLEAFHFVPMLSQPEAQEGMGAFLGKRKPDFSKFS